MNNSLSVLLFVWIGFSIPVYADVDFKAYMECYQETVDFPGGHATVGNMTIEDRKSYSMDRTPDLYLNAFAIYDDSLPGFYVMTREGVRRYDTGLQKWKSEGGSAVDKIKLAVPDEGESKDFQIEVHKKTDKKDVTFSVVTHGNPKGARYGGPGGVVQATPQIMAQFERQLKEQWKKIPDLCAKFCDAVQDEDPDWGKRLASQFVDKCSHVTNLAKEFEKVKSEILKVEPKIQREPTLKDSRHAPATRTD